MYNSAASLSYYFVGYTTPPRAASAAYKKPPRIEGIKFTREEWISQSYFGGGYEGRHLGMSSGLQG
jgi:hypothetical protein